MKTNWNRKKTKGRKGLKKKLKKHIDTETQTFAHKTVSHNIHVKACKV